VCKVFLHPATPAGDEADDLDAVLASTRLAAKRGPEPGAALAVRRRKAPSEPRFDDVGRRPPTASATRSTHTHTNKHTASSSDPFGWRQCGRSPQPSGVGRPSSRPRLTSKPASAGRVTVRARGPDRTAKRPRIGGKPSTSPRRSGPGTGPAGTRAGSRRPGAGRRVDPLSLSVGSGVQQQRWPQKGGRKEGHEQPAPQLKASAALANRLST
jgi:hypothetical protein